ncbi:MAG: sulfite exporter TauE/SafE family protein [Geminicoccaceae bacterium]
MALALASPLLLDGRGLLLASGCVLVASIARGFSGFGFAIGAVPLLSLVLEPVRVVPLVMLLQAVAGLDTTWRQRRLVDWPTTGWLLAGASAGLVPGVALLASLSADLLHLLIAAIVVPSTALLGLGWRLRAMPGRGTTALIGAVAGLLNGAAAMPGPPVIALYLAAPRPQAVCRASLVSFFLITGVAGILVAATRGLIDAGSLVLAGLLAPAMLLGSWLGGRAFALGGARCYRPASLAFLVAIAATALLQALRAF